jgi:hypothetical protein
MISILVANKLELKKKAENKMSLILILEARLPIIKKKNHLLEEAT